MRKFVLDSIAVREIVRYICTPHTHSQKCGADRSICCLLELHGSVCVCVCVRGSVRHTHFTGKKIAFRKRVKKQPNTENYNCIFGRGRAISFSRKNAIKIVFKCYVLGAHKNASKYMYNIDSRRIVENEKTGTFLRK